MGFCLKHGQNYDEKHGGFCFQCVAHHQPALNEYEIALRVIRANKIHDHQSVSDFEDMLQRLNAK